MTIGQALERAQGGNLFARLARMTSLSAGDCRKALEGLCPAIAARLQETGRDPEKFEQLLAMLDDNEGDLLADGDPAGRDADEDGRAVLLSVYGSEKVANEGARATAKALRLDESAVVRLMPVAAALVLAVLATRHRELAEDESGATAKKAPTTTSSTRPSGGILSVLVAAIGAGIARAVMNRLRPRRRRRYSYARPRYGSREPSRRGRRNRQPSLDEIFRGLIG